MKKQIGVLGVLLVMIALFESCSEPAGVHSAERLFDSALYHTYKISYYENDNTNHTADFENFRITFNGDSTVSVEQHEIAFIGTWSTSDDIDGNSRFDDDEPGVSDDRFIMNFPTSEDEIINTLSKEWRVMSFNDFEIKLINKTEDAEFFEYLTLQRS